MRPDVLQKPESSPTAKQLASWLKTADKATGLLEGSIAGLVFMTTTLTGFEIRKVYVMLF